jgi:demethoxyubiquinone hydroxylase (CLK1/Coq7/Cat5 family)
LETGAKTVDAQSRGSAPVPDPAGPLVRDMERTLKSELGAQSMYALLPVLVRDRELRRLLGDLRAQQREHVAMLAAAITSLGGRPARRSWRRSVAAWALFLVTPVLGLRFALRLCEEAAATVARWHAEYALYLADMGRLDEARTCRAISHRRLQEHFALRAWTENFGVRGARRRGDDDDPVA